MTHRRPFAARAALPLALGLAALAALSPAAAAPAAAQVTPPVRAHLEWRTIRTEHFSVHYPAGAEEWARTFASRLEPAHQVVSAMVGSEPADRIQVVIEDPSGVSNGFAYSLPGTPGLVIWPTPPDPRSQLGNNRGQAEQLAIHEFAHLAHLTRPSRNPRQRFWARIIPFRVAPLARTSPRWITEGYATYVEGRLTGSGRPASAVRAATLRQWALEGKLPTYAQMSASSAFQGGSMAYLSGSAFLEWLVERRGEESLVHLWRRMSARTPRTFDEAFAGVYGGSPADLYDRFTVEVTERALRARDLLRAAGVEEGDTVQALSWATGDPAVSPGGKQVAIVLRGAAGVPPRVVVWSTEAVPDTAYEKARRRLLERDPQDVPAIEWRPRPLRVLTTLLPVGGRGHDTPRFLPGGDSILLTRAEPTGDGATRPDLFVWSWRKGGLRRVTRGASLRNPDPAPDGRSAAAVRCRWGICDVVRVDLRTGALRVLASGTPDTVWYRPRFSPDGRTLAASVQEGGRWRLVLLDAATGERRDLDAGGDGASRYDAAWFPGGRGLVVVSEEGGVANLQAVDLASGRTRALTRVTGAAMAPEPDPATGGILFLSLHARGLDLNRIHPDSVSPGAVAALPPALAPVAPPAPLAVDTLPRAPLPPARPYGTGPRGSRWLPAGGASADGGALGVMVASMDPIGRLTAMLRATYGLEAHPWGASLGGTWRGWRPSVGGEGFWLRHRPSEGDFPALEVLDADLLGGALWAEHAWAGGVGSRSLRVGGSAGRLGFREGEGRERVMGFAEYGFSGARTRGGASASTGLRFSGAAGRTGGETWRRGVASAALALRSGGFYVRGDAVYGRTNEDAPEWERFSVGGPETGIVNPSVLSQHVVMPGIPFGTVRGAEVMVLKASTTLGGLSPFLWAASGDGLERWHRAVGAEFSTDLGPAPLLRIPGARITGGAAYSLDEPLRDEFRLWLGVSYRP